MKYELNTISIGQSTHYELVKKSGLRRILFDKSCLQCISFHKKSCLRRILFRQIFLEPRCIWFEFFYPVCQFIDGENDLNSNTEWWQRQGLYQTVIKKVSNNKPFVKSNLLRHKSHNTILISKQFIRNNVQQGECLTESLQIWSWPSTQITLFERTRQSVRLDAVTTPLIRSEWILVYSSTSIWMDLSKQKYRRKNREMLSPTRY